MELDPKRVDHLGVIAGTIRKLGMIDQIDNLLGTNEQNEVTTGEAVAAMIINGLGFANRVISLTPQFFETKALDVLLRQGILSEHLNRHRLGRALDRIAEYGGEKLFTTLALNACLKEHVHLKMLSGDVTSYSVTGEYDEETDEHDIIIKHGYSKDHRPDLKQVVQDILSSQDGGIPIMTRIWPGNASDVEVLRERVNKLRECFKDSHETRCMIADSKLYVRENIEHLNRIKFITRVPATINMEQEVIKRAVAENAWQQIDEKYCAQEFIINHYNVDQRWIVYKSGHAFERTKKTLGKIVKNELEEYNKKLFHLQADRFACEADARKAVQKLVKKLKFHTLENIELIVHGKHERPGRPNGETHSFIYQIKASIVRSETAVEHQLIQRSCFVLTTNLKADEHDLTAILNFYKKQDLVEKSFAFIKDPKFFASSLFLKNQQRLQGLLVIMTLALLVYSLAQRHARQQLAVLKSTIPNQINKPTATPTLRWMFQLLEGINYVYVKIDNDEKTVWTGITELRRRIIKLFYPEVQKIYQIS